MISSEDLISVDPEKKKYFKIESNNVIPGGSKYSSEAINKRAEESRVSTRLHLNG